jgi:hypothetical protein
MDILFCSAPGTFNMRPVLAPAILKASANNAGFASMALDLNIEIHNLIIKKKKILIILTLMKMPN